MASLAIVARISVADKDQVPTGTRIRRRVQYRIEVQYSAINQLRKIGGNIRGPFRLGGAKRASHHGLPDPHECVSLVPELRALSVVCVQSPLTAMR